MADKRSHVVHARLCSQPMLLVTLAFSAGILVDRYAMNVAEAVGPRHWWTAAVFSASLGMTLVNFQCSRVSALALLGTFFCIGGAWQNYRWNLVPADEIGRYATSDAQPVCLHAIVASSTRWSPAPEPNPLRAIPGQPRSQVLLRITRIRDGLVWRAASGRARLQINGDAQDLNPGDRLLVFGRFAEPQPAMNPGQYDFADAERSAGRFCEIYARSPFCVTVQQTGSPLHIGRAIAHGSRWCEQQLARYVGFDQSSIALAMLLGNRDELSDETTESFIKTGSIHLLVVSGLHVGLLAGAAWTLLGCCRVPRVWAVVLTAGMILLYAGIVGARPPVVRASLLVIFALLALTSFRAIAKANILATSALVVLAWNPAELMRSGTQLSFLGIAAIVGYLHVRELNRITDPLMQMFMHYWAWHRHLRRWFGENAWGLVSVSLAVWIAVAPLVLYHFHIVALSGLVIGPLLWPAVAVALVAGLGICTVGYVFPPLAWLLGGICGGCLQLLSTTVAQASEWSWAYYYSPGPPLWWLVGLYGMLGFLAVFARRPLRTPNLLALIALWGAVGFSQAAIRDGRREQLECSFLAMGHGTCVVMQLPAGQNILYDAGSLGSPESAADVVSQFLWSRGMNHIDAVVISHADVDHYNALPQLLERFDVGSIYVSPVMFGSWRDDADGSATSYLQECIADSGVPVSEVWMNDRLHVADEDVNLEILHPPRFGLLGSDNANSVLLHITYLGHGILLPGDLESPGLEAVMAELPPDTEILLAPHHGSSHSDPSGFAAWCTPDWVILSGGAFDESSHATAESYSEVGAQILHTAESGAVTFAVTREGVTVETYHSADSAHLAGTD